MLNGALEVRPDIAVTADGTHRRLGVGVVGDFALVPLSCRPACLVGEVVGDCEIFPLALDPADGGNIAERVAIGTLQPQRALDVMRLHHT